MYALTSTTHSVVYKHIIYDIQHILNVIEKTFLLIQLLNCSYLSDMIRIDTLENKGGFPIA